MCSLCIASIGGGRRLAVRTAMEHPISALPRTPFPASRDFPSRGNEKIGGTGYCVTYDTDSQSRNVLASPLGEEGHEVAKGCTRVRMIMILDMDVTAERRHYNSHRPAGDTTTLGPEGPSNLRTLRPSGRSILRTLTPKVCLKAERLQSKMPAIFSWQAFGFAALFQTDRIGIRLIISGTSLFTF